MEVEGDSAVVAVEEAMEEEPEVAVDMEVEALEVVPVDMEEAVEDLPVVTEEAAAVQAVELAKVPQSSWPFLSP